MKNTIGDKIEIIVKENIEPGKEMIEMRKIVETVHIMSQKTKKSHVQAVIIWKEP